MSRRTDILDAARKASEVTLQFNLKARINDGYARIDPAYLASVAEVTLLYKKMDKLLGGFIRTEQSAGIIVNYDRPRGLVHMTCAHELGHFFLDHESNTDQTIDYGLNAEELERQANYFAYGLLAPQWLVAKTMREKRWGRNSLNDPLIVYQMSLRLGISFTAMVWSLANLSLVSKETALGLVKFQPRDLKHNLLANPELSLGNSDVWILDISDRDHILEPAFGDRFILNLPNHAGSGYLWSIDELQSEGFTISPVLRDARRNPINDVNRRVLVGGKETQKYILEIPEYFREQNRDVEDALSKAHIRQTISLSEKQDWTENSAIDEFKLFTEFEPIKNGFSAQEQEKRLASIRRSNDSSD